MNPRQRYLDLSRTCVLLLDDNRNTLTMLAEILRGLGVRDIVRAESCADARHKLKSVPVQLVIADIVVGNEDGLETVRWLRDHPNPNLAALPVVVVSSYASEARVIASGAAGANHFLAKPISVSGLAARISDAIIMQRHTAPPLAQSMML